MFPPQEAARLLVLGRNPDSDLLSLIQVWLPALELDSHIGPLTSWVDDLWSNSPDGLLLFTDSLEANEIQVLAAWAASRPHIPVLAIVGGRGLLGAEALLAHEKLKILPHPWSAAGLRQVLSLAKNLESAEATENAVGSLDEIEKDKAASEDFEAQKSPKRKGNSGGSQPNYSSTGSVFSSPRRSSPKPPAPSTGPKSRVPHCLPASELDLPGFPQKRESKSPQQPLQTPTKELLPPASSPLPKSSFHQSPRVKGTPAFAGEFLDGLVERFRDPLASLSGHLQLLRIQSSDPNPLLAPALQAAQEIEASLDALYLASDSHPIRPAKISGEYLAIEALKEAQRAGLAVQLDLDEDFLLRADESLVRVGLQCARVLLSRFGGTEDAELVLHCYRDSQRAVLEWGFARPPKSLDNGSVAPPPFLSLLLERFADRLDAKAVLVCSENDVPNVVGLAWPASSALTPIS